MTALRSMQLPSLLLLLGLLTAAASAQEGPENEELDLTELSLEELMSVDVEVTSVSKKPEALWGSAAAVYVLTGEKIRRSGASTIAEALRHIPGLHVARVHSGAWAISARGFNDQFANKMLVLVDGRTVYSPIFSGVFWQIQDLILEDIDRIEVIRGPGASLWGANAVNGVINIITKSAAATQGTLVTGTVGTETRGILGWRTGHAFADDRHWRAWGKLSSFDGLEDPDGGVDDRWGAGHAGFRTDWTPGRRDQVTLEGAAFDSSFHAGTTVPDTSFPFTRTVDLSAEFTGGHVLGRWSRTLEGGSALGLQGFWDAVDVETSLLDVDHDIFDLDFHHRIPTSSRNELVWGLGYRHTRLSSQGTPTLSFDPADRQDDLFSAFVQDELTVVPERLKVIVGTKFEDNDYTGFEVQPTARLAWTPRETQVVWGAVSRAVSTPSPAETDLRFLSAFIPDMGGGFDTNVVSFGDPGVDSEELIAYELGWRSRPREDLTIDLAAYYHDYDQLVTFEQGTPFFDPSGDLVVPVIADNKMHGETYGAELSAEWMASRRLSFEVAYTLLWMALELDQGSTDATSTDAEDTAPRHLVHLAGAYDLREDVELDAMLFWSDELPGLVDEWLRMDVILGWQANEATNLGLGVQGLFHDGDREFPSGPLGNASEMEVGVYFRLTWRM